MWAGGVRTGGALACARAVCGQAGRFRHPRYHGCLQRPACPLDCPISHVRISFGTHQVTNMYCASARTGAANMPRARPPVRAYAAVPCLRRACAVPAPCLRLALGRPRAPPGNTVWAQGTSAGSRGCWRQPWYRGCRKRPRLPALPPAGTAACRHCRLLALPASARAITWSSPDRAIPARSSAYRGTCAPRRAGR
jgi:hypothetical protein